MRGPVANETPPLEIVEHALRDVWAAIPVHYQS